MTYDLNGNTLSDGMNSYVWDARNRLATINGNSASFTYDPLPGSPAIGLRRWGGLGRRVGKTMQVVNGISVNTNYLYDGVNPVQELNGTTPTANLLTGGVDSWSPRFQMGCSAVSVMGA